MTKTLIALIMLCGSLTGVAPRFVAAQVTLTHATDKEKGAEEEVRRLNADEVEAFLHQDPKAMEHL